MSSPSAASLATSAALRFTDKVGSSQSGTTTGATGPDPPMSPNGSSQMSVRSGDRHEATEPGQEDSGWKKQQVVSAPCNRATTSNHRAYSTGCSTEARRQRLRLRQRNIVGTQFILVEKRETQKYLAFLTSPLYHHRTQPARAQFLTSTKCRAAVRVLLSVHTVRRVWPRF